MKIGFFLPNATFDMPGSPEVGGIETFAFTIGEALQKAGHTVVLYGGKPKAGRAHRATTLDLKLFEYWETHSIPDLGTRFQRLVQRIQFGNACEASWLDENFDAAILSKPFDWPVAWHWKRRQPRLKVVMGFHGTDFFLGDSLFYSAVDTAFAVSPHVADLAERRIKKRPVLLPNPVAVDFFNPGAAAIGSQSKLTIAASGRLVGWKGFHVLVDAVAYLRAANIPVEACLAGEGPEREALEKQIDSAGLNKEFKLVGKLDPESLRAMLRNSTVYAAPSIGMEAFSIAALEALSVGLPLVATDQIGLTAYLTERDYLSCPARDARALAQKLTIALKRQRDSAWTDQAARHKRIREQFAPEPIAARLVEIIEQIRK